MVVVEAFRRNPHVNLMDIFLDQTSERLNNWVDHPQWLLTRLPKNLILTAKNVAVEMAEDIAIAVKWIGDGIEHPRKAGQDVKAYWKEIKSGMKSLKTMWKESHRKAMANFFGGFLFYISNHSVEFGSQLFLLLFAGGFVFHQLGEGADVLLKTLGVTAETTTSGLKSALMGTLWFLHAIDDPLAMLPAFLEPLNQGVSVINEAKRLAGGNSTVTTFTTPGEEEKLREMVFGSIKSYDKMTGEERIAAFQKFQKFVCERTGGKPFEIPPEAVPEAKLKSNGIVNFDCSPATTNPSKPK